MTDVKITNNDGSNSLSVQTAPGVSQTISPGGNATFPLVDGGNGHLKLTASPSVSATIENVDGPSDAAVTGAIDARLDPGQSVTGTVSTEETKIRLAA